MAEVGNWFETRRRALPVQAVGNSSADRSTEVVHIVAALRQVRLLIPHYVLLSSTISTGRSCWYRLADRTDCTHCREAYAGSIVAGLTPYWKRFCVQDLASLSRSYLQLSICSFQCDSGEQ